MRGITGIVDLRARRPIDRGVLQRINERQHHRGPDQGALHVSVKRESPTVEAHDAH